MRYIIIIYIWLRKHNSTHIIYHSDDVLLHLYMILLLVLYNIYYYSYYRSFTYYYYSYHCYTIGKDITRLPGTVATEGKNLVENAFKMTTGAAKTGMIYI